MLFGSVKKQLAAFAPSSPRAFFTRAVAVLSLAIWLILAVAEVCPSFHAWLHGGSIPDDDNCAIVAIAHGNVQTVISEPPSMVPILGVEVAPRIEFSVVRPVTIFHSADRGPPASSVLS
jgi:hypothetical protein